MCNHYAVECDGEMIAADLSAEIIDMWEPGVTWPGRAAPIITNDRKLRVMSWGFQTRKPRKLAPKEGQAPYVIDHWTNARNLDSGLWRNAIATPAQRCLVPFTRFAEPKAKADRLDENDRDWWFTVNNMPMACFAGIWRDGIDEAEFAFLTCAPNALVAPKHPKAMPVILQPDDYDRWLAGDKATALELAAPFPSQLMGLDQARNSP